MEHRFRNRYSVGKSVALLSTIFLWAAGFAYAQVTIPNTFSAGTTISSGQVNANFTALKNVVDPLLVSNFTQFTSLNNNSANVTTATQAAYSKLDIGTLTFTKLRADTKIEVHVNSRFGSGTFTGGAPGIIFQVRIDDVATTLAQTQGAITTSAAVDFLSIFAVFQGLAAGSHSVSLWATTFIAGTGSTGVIVDPGGFFGGIVVKEVF